mgnify:CR=1 FL=1
MGTRHLICIVLDGEYKLAQYGQWDGYLEGQGTVIAKTLQADDFDLDALKRGARAAEVISYDVKKKVYREEFGVDLDVTDGIVPFEVSAAFRRKYEHLTRSHGAQVVRYLMTAANPQVQEPYLEFANDGLFCEWAYVLDLDREVVEVYRGFQKEPPAEDERFAKADQEPNDGGYYPVQLVAEATFTEFTSDYLYALSEKLDPDDE